jgi:hypothetical protein
MNVRPLIATLAFVSLAAPLAARADAPSGDINTVFAIDQAVKVDRAQFDRSDARIYVEDTLAGLTLAPSNVTREQVRRELAARPAQYIGA